MLEAVRGQLAAWHAAGVRAVRADLLLPQCSELRADRWVFVRGGREIDLPLPDRAAGGRLRVIALGKAARSMAEGFFASVRRVASLPGAAARVDAGLVITHEITPAAITAEAITPAAITPEAITPAARPGAPPWREIFGDHPYPGARSEQAARELLDFIGRPLAADRFLVLLSGGASALCALPVAGITLEAKRAATRELMLAGAPIDELNRLRTRLSAIKGGKLARRMAPARLITLAVSDVAGDDPAVIGSGPTFDPPAAPCLVIAKLDDALQAIAAAAVDHAEVCMLGRTLYGTLVDEAQRIAQTLRAAPPPSRPRLWIAGGEPRVTVHGGGRGGRAQELALRLAAAVAREIPTRRVAGLVAGTDGADGPTHAAGAFFDGDSIARIAAADIDLEAALAASDSHAVLDAVGDLFVTGPTGTNVADLLLVLESPR